MTIDNMVEQVELIVQSWYVFGGGSTNKTELYNGTTWASQPNMANSRGSPHGGSGAYKIMG